MAPAGRQGHPKATIGTPKGDIVDHNRTTPSMEEDTAANPSGALPRSKRRICTISQCQYSRWMVKCHGVKAFAYFCFVCASWLWCLLPGTLNDHQSRTAGWTPCISMRDCGIYFQRKSHYLKNFTNHNLSSKNCHWYRSIYYWVLVPG